MESDGSEEALGITGKDVSEGQVRTESGLLNAYGSTVVRSKMKIEPPLDVKRMSLILAALSIAWEETHIEVYASVCLFFNC